MVCKKCTILKNSLTYLTGKDIHIGYTGLKAQIQKQMGRKNSKELVDLFDLLLLRFLLSNSELD